MMNLDEIKTAIHSHNKGSFTTIETYKTLKTKKGLCRQVYRESISNNWTFWG